MTDGAPQLRVCRYCTCTERFPCAIPTDMLQELLGAPPGEVARCWWVRPNVCSAPACVDAAYRDLAPVGTGAARVLAGP